ncbi:MAG TPA: glycosyltransferase [Bdellovibrionota bacterium]|nr:glycosyltransferase [Bdellovibrionota bacterium]
MNRLSVVSAAYPFAHVGPDAIGGAEQILGIIDRALVQAGHRSLVIGSEGSQVSGELFRVSRTEGEIGDEERRRTYREVRELLEKVLRKESVDIVHMHGPDFYEYLPTASVPVLATLHLPLAWYPPEIFRMDRPHTFLNGVSACQMRSMERVPANLLLPIENGIRMEDFGEFSPDVKRVKRRFLLSFGRICPEKGFHLALDAARKADFPIFLGGHVFQYRSHVEYFRSEIAPRLSRSRRFIGPIGLKRKRRLIAAARCVLIPSLAAETSSLVAMESLSLGTPVIAFRSGALPEIVEHGRTGFVVRDVDEMVEAIRRIGEIDPADCVRAARSRFSSGRMVRDYFRAYADILAASVPQSSCQSSGIRKVA